MSKVKTFTRKPSQKRKEFESESESSAPKRRELPSSASGFKTQDIDAMNVSFQGVSAMNVVIPDVEVENFPYEYRNFLRKLLTTLRISVEVQTFTDRRLLKSKDLNANVSGNFGW
ncbi:14526_t:CDS:2 [Funneliformis geosporum]|uniref:14526_t:CDS:1 n=1 Tax=Funneliformis geosporum TaxID=1117311 RepID=A0A9W4SY99_9GLOM|nr:14526_t:CDS:2 [Funneliformis geosporum]